MLVLVPRCLWQSRSMCKFCAVGQVFYEAGACECEVSGGLPPAECVATPGAQARVQEEEVDADAASLGQPGHAQVQLEVSTRTLLQALCA